tara:strand:+ start:66 stop:266 length:201 start_codon:yes stop_codon:yes gene_type:complete
MSKQISNPPNKRRNKNMLTNRSKSKVRKVVKGLKKASKLHAGQAKTLKGLLNGKKKRPQSRNRKKT